VPELQGLPLNPTGDKIAGATNQVSLDVACGDGCRLIH
jgi:hypothetical protein